MGLAKRVHLVIRRLGWRGGVLAALGAAFLAFSLFSTGDSIASGSLNGRITKLQISFDGPCNPGNIDSNSPSVPPSGSLGSGLVIKTTSTVFGCMAAECSPENLLIGSELFTYSSISAETLSAIPSDTWTGPLTVRNVLATAVDRNNDGDTLDLGEACPAQNHYPDQFPSIGYMFVGTELVHYSGYSDSTIMVDGRGTGPTDHPIGSFVRAQNLLNLLDRQVPRYPGGAPTAPAGHSAGATVTSPQVFMDCRALLLQPMGTAAIGSRSRCYFILEPGYDTVNCVSTPSTCYWPDNHPSLSPAFPIVPNDALQPLLPVFYHNVSEGTITPSGPNLILALKTQFAFLNCFEQIPNLLWVQVTTDITVTKASTTNTGTFQVHAYENSTCTSPAALIFGNTNNVTSTALDGAWVDWDTDQDGCADAKELNIGELLGGNRDPYSYWDYMNPTHDQQNRVDDILLVVSKYHVNDSDANPGFPPFVGAYDQDVDRSAVAGAKPWNLGPPDGQVNVPDILAAVKSYHHDC